MSGMPGMAAMPEVAPAPAKSKKTAEHAPQQREESPAFTLEHSDLTFELTKDLTQIAQLCLPVFRTPPTKALYLQLFHSLTGGATCINGRQYMGNTPTVIGGTATKMRFGVVGMGSESHTFHIHGHRWILPGPDGITPTAIQGSAQVRAVSQFEDTRIFGPANSFVFTIQGQSGSFMRAGGPGAAQSLGEWHMHCHVLMHMMTGMMGSLLIINGGELALALPSGVPCPDDSQPDTNGGGNGPKTVTVHVQDFQFSPKTANINAGDTIHWVWDAGNHSVISDTNLWDSGIKNNGSTFDRVFAAAGSFPYYCIVHGGPGGAGMAGTINVT